MPPEARNQFTQVPIISAVLTPQRFHGHEEHKRSFHEHFDHERHRGGEGLLNDHRKYRRSPVVDGLTSGQSACSVSCREKRLTLALQSAVTLKASDQPERVVQGERKCGTSAHLGGRDQ
jgi:hypothetical protein